MQTQKTQQQLLTVKDVAALIQCSPATVWRRVKDGALPKPIKLGGVTRWHPDDLAHALHADRSHQDGGH